MLRLPRAGSFRSNPIYGSMAIVYSGSKTEPDTMLQWLLMDTYAAGHGEGSLYGKGIYAVHELTGTKTERGDYGRYIYKYRINIHGYIIFDRDVCEKVYGRWMQPHEQAQMLRYPKDVVAALKKNEVPDGTEYSSKIAQPASKMIKGLVKGIVYTGMNDGRCVLIYDAGTILPIGWKFALMHGGKRNDTWNAFQLTPDMQAAYKERISKISSSSFSASKYEKTEQDKLKFQRDTSGRLVHAGDINRSDFLGEIKLPRDLTVIGSLYLEKTNITSLPPGLKVGRHLDLSFTNIKSLPPGLKVGGYLDLRNTNIKSLPSGLEVGHGLNLAGTKTLTSLPPGLKVGGSLNLDHTKITSLPPDLKVGGYLSLRDTPLTSLPSDLKVGDDLDLSGTKITSLPPGLEVGGDLYLRFGNITSLPSGLKVGGSLFLGYTPIAFLPPDLQVGGDLDLRFTPITSLPPDLQVGGKIIR